MSLQNRIIVILTVVTVLYSVTLLAENVTSENTDLAPPVITIYQGKLQGATYLSRNGRQYSAFLAVPFAKATVRFEPPQEPDSWDGVKLATEFPPICFQFSPVKQGMEGVEDCLTLNVYSPKLHSGENEFGRLPVMVLFHGGGFQFGSGNYHEAKYFMDEKVVLVTVQYRLGALGFLNTGDDVVTGNMGLKDQTAALKWVQKNIDKFGGDASKVTIFGYSAGGASVHYHMLSPLSKGLFRGGISQSGSALNPWALQKNPKKYALQLAKNVGCTTETTKEMVECLRNKSPSQIITGQLKLVKYPYEFDLTRSALFVPSVENGESSNKFLPDTPYKLLKSGQTASQVPWIVGITRDEGAFYSANILEDEKSMDLANTNLVEMAPNILYYENSASPSTQNQISKKVLEFYFGNDRITRDKYLELGRVFGDRFFVTGISRAVREYAKTSKSSVYPYIFEFEGDHSIVQGFLKTKYSYGVAHCDELKYLFNNTFGAPEYESNTDEGRFSENLTKLFVSFAKDGKPTSTFGSAKAWEPFKLSPEVSPDKASVEWYVIGKDTKILKEDPFKLRTDFWEGLPLKELEKEDYLDEKDEL